MYLPHVMKVNKFGSLFFLFFAQIVSALSICCNLIFRKKISALVFCICLLDLICKLVYRFKSKSMSLMALYQVEIMNGEFYRTPF